MIQHTPLNVQYKIKLHPPPTKYHPSKGSWYGVGKFTVEWYNVFMSPIFHTSPWKTINSHLINPSSIQILIDRNPHLMHLGLQYRGHISTHPWSCDANQEESFGWVLLTIPTQYLYYFMTVPQTCLPRQMDDYSFIIALDMCKMSCILTTQNMEFWDTFL